MDPAVFWRADRDPDAPAPPEPWPGRYEAFMEACALYSGRRERDLVDLVAALGEGAEQAAKQVNPARM